MDLCHNKERYKINYDLKTFLSKNMGFKNPTLMNINVGTAVISYFSEISGTSSASNFIKIKKLNQIYIKLPSTCSLLTLEVTNHTLLYTV